MLIAAETSGSFSDISSFRAVKRLATMPNIEQKVRPNNSQSDSWVNWPPPNITLHNHRFGVNGSHDFICFGREKSKQLPVALLAHAAFLARLLRQPFAAPRAPHAGMLACGSPSSKTKIPAALSAGCRKSKRPLQV
jgi:hypothetical protein